MTDIDPADSPATPKELRDFLTAWVTLEQSAHLHARTRSTELLDKLTAHLGTDPRDLESATDTILTSDLVNQQLAVTALAGDSEILGLNPSVGQVGMAVSLKTLAAGAMHVPSEVVPITWTEHPIDVDEQLRCVAAGVWLAELDGQPLAIGMWPLEGHGPSPRIQIEAMANTPELSRRSIQVLAELRGEHNVYRGKTLGFVFSEYGEFGLRFIAPQPVTRDQLILPSEDLESIERHTIGLSEKAAELRARGRHLKRGLLLYGPPGTGKTHTVSYLINAMPGRTTVILQGPSAGASGQAAAIARSFPPATIVIEDVDLIAYERGMGIGDNPMLFQLLNEMDGFADDSDLLFILTTNRADVLEPALASRPGRVDQAIEIAKPDAPARRRLVELYLGDIDHAVTSFDSTVDRLEGVTASFVKELARRAVMASIDANAPLDDELLDHAVTDLLERSGPVTQRALGVGSGDGDLDDFGEDGMHFEF